MRKDPVTTFLGFIAANTRAWRLERGLTQEGLAEKADLDLRFVQRIERASTNLSMSVLLSLSRALDVAPTLLFQSAKLEPPQRGRPRVGAARDGKRAAKTKK